MLHNPSVGDAFAWILCVALHIIYTCSNWCFSCLLKALEKAPLGPTLFRNTEMSCPLKSCHLIWAWLAFACTTLIGLFEGKPKGIEGRLLSWFTLCRTLMQQHRLKSLLCFNLRIFSKSINIRLWFILRFDSLALSKGNITTDFWLINLLKNVTVKIWIPSLHRACCLLLFQEIVLS